MPVPLVTVCIPTFDRLPYLREAVASARSQTLPNIEILIGDDGDSAELRSWCLAQSAEDSRIRYEKTPTRLRLAGNWNFLVDGARAPFVTLMGDDDRLLPTFCERLAGEAERTQADVVFSNHSIINAKGERSEEQSTAATLIYGRTTLKEGVVNEVHNMVWANSVPMSASIVRTESTRRLRFKTDINTPELELFVRMASEGARFVFVADYLVEYRVHQTSETSRGLTIDRLAEYLQDVEVPVKAEPAKRALLKTLVVGGVDVRMRRGDLTGARALLRSPYYPQGITRANAAVQRAVLVLPDPFVVPMYTSIRRCVKTLQSIRRNRSL